MAADLSASESMVRALQAGFQVRQQREDHEKQLEHEKLQQMVMKLQMDQMKAGAAQREYELKQKHAEGMFAAMQGQPAASFATQIPTAPANAIPGVTLPQTGGAESVPTGPRPVQFPGLPEELGGGPGFSATPQTAEDLITQSRRAALEKEFTTPQKVAPGERVILGGKVIAEGGQKLMGVPAGGLADAATGEIVVQPPEKSTESSEFAQFQQAYAEGLGASSFKGLSPSQKMGAFPAYTKAKQDPATMAAVEAQRAATLEATQARVEAAKRALATLPPTAQRRVDSKSRAFETLQVVKNTQKMSEAVNYANSLDIHTTNPSDDQALIYAFAKAMDPDSVVREGEYATVQKYSQTWADQFGFKVARIFSNTAFLTPEARANMKKTIGAKFEAAHQQYNAVRKSYSQQINQITGQSDGDTFLTDYGAAFPGSGGKIIVTAPDGSAHPFDTQAQADAFKQLAGIH